MHSLQLITLASVCTACAALGPRLGAHLLGRAERKRSLSICQRESSGQKHSMQLATGSGSLGSLRALASPNDASDMLDLKGKRHVNGR